MELPFDVLMADLMIIAGGLATLPWCDFLINVLNWRYERPTWQKAVILGVTLFLPMSLASLLAVLLYPGAF